MRALLTLLLLGGGAVLLSQSARGQIAMPNIWAKGDVNPLEFGQQWFQVHFEQRVIIRIPQQTSPPAKSSKSQTPRYREEKIGKCLLMDKLVASRPGPKESLDLVTRDGVLIRAYLGDGCLAREFYAGAYMERPADGKLCIDRDLLHARTGAQCEIDRFRLLVPA